MALTDPIENSKRVREGLHSLISHRAVEFAKASSHLIVVFDGTYNQYSGGRILLFQQYIQDVTGILPTVNKMVPACIKIFFSFGDIGREQYTQIGDILRSQESIELYQSLNISQLQFNGSIILTSRGYSIVRN